MIGLLLDPFEVAWMLLKQSREEQLRADVARHEASVRQISEHLDEKHPNYISIDAIRQAFGSTPEALELHKRALETAKAKLSEYMSGRGAKEAERKKERVRQKNLERQAFMDRTRELSAQRQQSAQAKDDARIQAEKDAEEAKRRAEEEKHEKERIRQEKKREYQERKQRREGKQPEQATAIEDPDAPIESVLEEFNRREQAKLGGDAKKPPTVRPPRRVAVRRPPPPPEPPKVEEEDDGKEEWERILEEQSGVGNYDPYGDD
jgi:hypothetical protein